MEARRIPLFPLKTVLFPGMLLPLHIFEGRYQGLVHACLAGDRTFGVCLIRSGEEVGPPADPYPVGTRCRILDVTHLEDGRMNLMTLGQDRFRIQRLFHERPYLEAEVEPYPELEAGELGALPETAGEAATAYLRLLLGSGPEQERALRLPGDPVLLSYLLGAVLQVALPVRQELLETRVTAERLRRQVVLLQEESRRLEEAGAGPERPVRPFQADPRKISLN